MRNEKGFTLMELMAALFIGGMVTAALVLVWKTASVQTSQGQRQTIIRNQISSFQRQLYKDFAAADIIASPPRNSNNTANIDVLLSGLKKAKRIDATHYEPFAMGSSAEGPTKAFLYCLGTGAKEGMILRYEHIINYDTDEPHKLLFTDESEAHTTLEDNFSEDCLDEGTPVLTNFHLTSVSRSDTGVYSLQGVVERTFANVTGTTPIIVQINETLSESGGL